LKDAMNEAETNPMEAAAATTSVAHCPSFLALARWEASSEGDVAPHIHGCLRCTARVAQLRLDRADLLGADPAAASRLAARQILIRAQTHADVPWHATLISRWRQIAGIALPAFAAIALFAVTSPRFRHTTAINEAPAAGAPAVRAKGGLLFEIYRQPVGGGLVTMAGDGDRYQAGDRLRFTYTTAAPGYLSVIGVDDSGAVFPYYPKDGTPGLPVPAAAKVTLPDSIELDEHRGLERIFALWSPRPIDAAAVKDAVSQSVRAAAGNLESLIHLPIDAVQVTRLLRRP
jgi:hypothetical protein